VNFTFTFLCAVHALGQEGGDCSEEDLERAGREGAQCLRESRLVGPLLQRSPTQRLLNDFSARFLKRGVILGLVNPDRRVIPGGKCNGVSFGVF